MSLITTEVNGKPVIKFASNKASAQVLSKQAKSDHVRLNKTKAKSHENVNRSSVITSTKLREIQGFLDEPTSRPQLNSKPETKKSSENLFNLSTVQPIDSNNNAISEREESTDSLADRLMRLTAEKFKDKLSEEELVDVLAEVYKEVKGKHYQPSKTGETPAPGKTAPTKDLVESTAQTTLSSESPSEHPEKKPERLSIRERKLRQWQLEREEMSKLPEQSPWSKLGSNCNAQSSTSRRPEELRSSRDSGIDNQSESNFASKSLLSMVPREEEVPETPPGFNRGRGMATLDVHQGQAELQLKRKKQAEFQETIAAQIEENRRRRLQEEEQRRHQDALEERRLAQERERMRLELAGEHSRARQTSTEQDRLLYERLCEARAQAEAEKHSRMTAHARQAHAAPTIVTNTMAKLAPAQSQASPIVHEPAMTVHVERQSTSSRTVERGGVFVEEPAMLSSHEVQTDDALVTEWLARVNQGIVHAPAPSKQPLLRNSQSSSRTVRSSMPKLHQSTKEVTPRPTPRRWLPFRNAHKQQEEVPPLSHRGAFTRHETRIAQEARERARQARQRQLHRMAEANSDRIPMATMQRTKQRQQPTPQAENAASAVPVRHAIEESPIPSAPPMRREDTYTTRPLDIVRTSDYLDPAFAEVPVPVSRETTGHLRAREAYRRNLDPAHFGSVHDPIPSSSGPRLRNSFSERAKNESHSSVNKTIVANKEENIFHHLSNLREGLALRQERLTHEFDDEWTQ